MTLYVSDDDLTEWLGLDDNDDLSKVSWANAGAKAGIDNWLGRNFDTPAAQAADTSRYFSPLGNMCPTDDLISITTVAIDTAENGTYSVTLSASDWFATPIGGIGPQQKTGWPYTAIVTYRTVWFRQTIRPFVKVTGQYGWSAVPDDVKLAARLYGAELFKLNEAPLGTSWTENGNDVIIRNNRPLRDLLQPYKKLNAADGRFMVA